jgi:uncharacterized protein YbbC (DUF1343 family)
MYIGSCLFEGTNLNEGRGTDTPFELIGAPWLDASSVLDAIDEVASAGLRIDVVRYTPVAIPGKASNPRYQDQVCNGLRLTVQDPQQARPFTTTVALLAAIRKIHPRDFEWGESFDILAGSADLRRQIEQGLSWRQIIASFEPGLVRFDRERPRLYEPNLRDDTQLIGASAR